MEARLAGEVQLPLELFHYEPRYRSAMLRAFGGYVIASSDQVTPLYLHGGAGGSALGQAHLLSLLYHTSGRPCTSLLRNFNLYAPLQ